MIQLLLALLTLPSGASAGTAKWVNDAAFYADNTEYFNRYREGETLLGGQLLSYLDMTAGDKTSLHLGVFVDRAHGETRFVEPILPILSFRYVDGPTTAILGWLDTTDRHGLIEPLLSRALEFLRPEYGAQWIHGGDRAKANVFLNWQRLVTPAQREWFDAGGAASVQVAGGLRALAQGHVFHQGGQQSTVGPVANSAAGALGLEYAGGGTARPFGVSAYGIASRDSFFRSSGVSGRAAYVRGWCAPYGGWKLFGAWFNGEKFIHAEGDPLYSSLAFASGAPTRTLRDVLTSQSFTGVTLDTHRTYKEWGVSKAWVLDQASSLELEYRGQWIEERYEFAYRVVARMRFDKLLW